MDIRKKIFMDKQGLIDNGAINIVAFGDSVTHGSLNYAIDYESVYWERLRKKILKIRNYVPVNAICAGIGAVTADGSVRRIDSQVMSHNPDLVIVCFGLNDVNGPLDKFLNALRTIFDKCQNGGAEVIFMTPNMMNTYIADDTLESDREYAAVTMKAQTSGRMDMYMNEAVQLAESMGVTVCDCYSEWKKLAETQDTTLLLCNRVNHPSAEMHELFAQKLFETIFKDNPEIIAEIPSTMFSQNS